MRRFLTAICFGTFAAAVTSLFVLIVHYVPDPLRTLYFPIAVAWVFGALWCFLTEEIR